MSWFKRVKGDGAKGNSLTDLAGFSSGVQASAEYKLGDTGDRLERFQEALKDRADINDVGRGGRK